MELINLKGSGSNRSSCLSFNGFGIVANGSTVIDKIHHIDRGYENIIEKLSACGAVMKGFRMDNIFFYEHTEFLTKFSNFKNKRSLEMTLWVC